MADYFRRDPALVEKRVKKVPVYKGKMIDFCVDRVRLPDGKQATREYIDHPGAVAVLPFLDRERVVLVRQYRYPVEEVTLEMPAGKLDRGEKPLPCVRRELEEETGYRPGKIDYLLSYWPTPAFANELIHLYVVTGLKPGKFRPDADEFIAPAVVRFDEALRMVKTGKIKDSKTCIGLLAYAAFRK